MTRTQQRSAAMTCPACGSGVLAIEQMDPSTGMVGCSCGHQAYAGYLAEADYLGRRLAWLGDRIAEGDAAPAPEPARQFGVWDPRTVSPGGTTPSDDGRRVSVQTLLLSVGALLLVVAAAVFTAVAWPSLGPAGQLVLVIGTTVVVAGLAVGLRTRLHGTAEALAALAFGLVLVNVAAAPGLGLLPEGWLESDSVYWLVALGTLAGVAVLAGHRTRLRAWVWLGWMSAAMASGVAAAVVSEAAGGGAPSFAASLAITSVGGVVLLLAPWTWPSFTADRWPMGVAGAGCLAVSGLTVTGIVLAGNALGEALFTTATTTGVVVLLLTRMGRAAPVPFQVGAGMLCGVTAGLLLTMPVPDGLAWAAPLAAATGGALVVAGVRARHDAAGMVAAVPVWATWLVVGLSTAERSGTSQADLKLAVALFSVVVAVTLLASAWLAPGTPAVTWLAWPGALAGFVALVAGVPSAYPETLEAWSLPAAALLGVAGLVSCRGREVSSLERVGPAVSVALLPSALATWTAPWVQGGTAESRVDLIRLLAVLGVGGALTVLGARHHWLGVLLPASAAVVIAGTAQLWSGLEALPRWVALGLVGGLLVLAGARFEWVRDEGRRARGWAHQLG